MNLKNFEKGTYLLVIYQSSTIRKVKRRGFLLKVGMKKLLLEAVTSGFCYHVPIASIISIQETEVRK